ncbi:MAG: efflux RND transporter permease subunit, partial [Candidatus Poribacteria bacterium]|nr:efflux RND transporter permease subunit [Candidatus Poribacteria bacterium]
MWLGRFSVRNSVLINVVMVAILAVGAYSFLAIPRELMPEITFNWAFVQVSYPGASPEEVEQLITEPLEDAIDDVDKIDMVTSGSSEGASFISVKFEQNLSDDEFDKRYQDLRTAIDSTPLPDGAEDPVFIKLDTQTWNPVISVIVSGDLPETRLKEIAEDLDDRIMQIKGVARIIDAGIREREVWVEIDPDKLDRLGVTLPEVVQALRAKNVNIPGGTVTGGRSEYILRTLGQFGALGEISEVVVRSYDSGHQVRIRDVATIRDTWQEAMILSRLNGLPSMTLNITKKSGESTIRIVRDVKKLVDEYRVASLPSGAHLDI